MKKLFGFPLTVIAMFISLQTFSQSFADNALLFSQTRPGGSARIQALGGAQTALGGDYSSALSNPAGLGMFNRTEFTFSPAMNFYTSSSSYLGQSEKDSKSVFNIPGLSAVFHLSKEKGKLLSGSFAISMTRTNDLNNIFQYHGQNSKTSIIDYFIEDAYGFSVDHLPSPNDDIPTLNFDFPTGLAYDNYLIQDSAFLFNNPIAPKDYIEYFSVLGTYPNDPNDTRTVSRKENNNAKGAQYQWSFGYGANYADKLFFGASLGISTLRYTYKRTYRESDFYFELDPQFSPLAQLELEENVDIKGSGVNLTLGLIARPIDFIQVGISYVTPTYYQITDTYTARISTQWNNFDYDLYYFNQPGTKLNDFDYTSEQAAVLDYSLNTPGKLNVGAAFFAGKYGFVTGDLEFVNYSNAKYKSLTTDVSFDSDNSSIKSYYKDVINYRFGAEFRYKEFRIRGGYNKQANPYQSGVDVDKNIQTFSGGVGLKKSKFYVDLTLMQSQWENKYSPYVFKDGSAPIVDLKNIVTSCMVTVGVTL